MPAPKDLHPGKSPLHFFGNELRHYQLRADFTQDQLGSRVNYSGDTISKIETGDQAPNLYLAERCDEILSTDGALTRLMVMVQQAAFPAPFRPWVEAEQEAVSLRYWELAVIPGLLQTADYARELLKMHPGTTGERVEELVAARMERKKILDRDDPLMWFLIAEDVLSYPVGDSKVMCEQLQALIEATHHSYVNVQVVPTSARVHAGRNGAYAIASFNGEPDVVYLENARAGQVTDRSELVI